jgi:CheY-like chemotaxis protein
VGQAQAVSLAQRPAGNAATDRRPLVVVAVDDDALVLTNTIAMLDDLGHTAIAASSGPEALDILRQQGSVDLVITDYAMPRMTGLQLADAIKKEWPELPVIIATGFAEMEPETELNLPKLAKPFTEAELAKELERIIPKPPGSGRVLKFPTVGSKS